MDVTDDRTEQLVRQTLNAVANQVRSPEAEDEDAQVDQRSTRSRATVTALRRTHRRKRRLAIIAACLVVVLVAGGVALLTRQPEKSPKVSVGQSTVEPSVADAPPYGLPATDAEITSLLPLSTYFEQSYEGTYAGSSAQLTVSIQVVPDVLQKGVESLSGCLADFPKVEVNGHEGCTFSIVAQGTKEVVSWVEDSNSVIGLQSTTLSRDQLVELASTARRDGSRVALDPVPDGLQPSGTHIDPNADHPGYVYVNFDHNDCDYFLTRELSTTLPTGSAVTINGYPGARTAENTIAWVVRGALMTLRVGSIQGPGDPVHIQPEGPPPTGAPTCDLQATAATIRYITEADWKQLVGDHNTDTSATTTTPPATTSSPTLGSSEPQYEGDEAQIADVFRTFISGPDLDTLVSLLEDGEALRETLSKEPAGKTGTPSARIDSVALTDDTHATEDVPRSVELGWRPGCWSGGLLSLARGCDGLELVVERDA